MTEFGTEKDMSVTFPDALSLFLNNFLTATIKFEFGNLINENSNLRVQFKKLFQ